MFWCRVAAIPMLILVAAISEILQFPGSYRLLVLVVIFFILVDIASILRGIIRDTFLVFASLALGIVIAESLAIVAEPKISISVTDGIYATKPVLGWGPGHIGRYHDERTDLFNGRTIYNVDYTIDRNLIRQTDSAESGDAVVFFGDSLTFGTGLSDSDTLPQQFADLFDRKVRVLNLAYVGYGPSQFLQILQNGLFDSVIGSKPNVFIFLTAAWHTERTACKGDWVRRAPRFVLERNRVVLRGICSDGQYIHFRDWLRPFAFYRLLIEPFILKPTDEDVELYIQILIEAVRVAERRYGIKTIIPYIRNSGYLKNTVHFTDDIVIERLRDGGALVVDASLQEHESAGAVLAIPGDGHPTALANRLRAILLKEYMEHNLTVTWFSKSTKHGL